MAQPISPTPIPWWKSVIRAFGQLRTVNKIILGAGSLAAAIAAILALVLPLLPQSAAENSARFTAVDAVSPMYLSQYAQTSQTVNLQSAGNQRATAQLLGALSTEGSSPSSAAPGDASPSAAQSPSPSLSPTASAGTSGPDVTQSASASSSPCASASCAPTTPGTGPAAASSGIKALPPSGMSQREAGAYADKVAGLLLKAHPNLSPELCSAPSDRCHHLKADLVRDTGCTQMSGQAPSVTDCAQKAAGLLGGDTRTASTGNQADGGEKTAEPVGEFITADLDLSGLKDQPVMLSWSIFAEDSSSQLPRQWEGQFVVYRLVATTDDDSASVALWVPLPRQHGPYVVRLTLSLGSAVLAGQDSGPFS